MWTLICLLKQPLLAALVIGEVWNVLLQDRIDEAEALVAELRDEADSLPAMQVRPWQPESHVNRVGHTGLLSHCC